jgi:MYXO-CTERM domain-containing protein
MRCDPSPRQLVPALVAVILFSGASAEAVSLGVSSATVSQPGGAAQVCVSLVTGGQEVAGTQNDLVWDGTCMSLNDNGCSAAGSHGKQVNTRIQNSADFRMRVLVLSLSDVDPIDDGVLYCCNVQGEAPAGSCCSISVVNTGASDSKGNAVGGVGGNTGRVCTQGGGGSGGGAVGAFTGNQQANSIANNPAPLDQGMPAGNSGGGNAGSGGSAPPASQVLPGGGGGAPVPAAGGAQVLPGGGGGTQVLPGGGGGEQAPQVAQVPVTPIALPTRAAAAPVAPAAPVPALAPATVAATAVAAAPTAPPTAAEVPTVVPTAVPPTQKPASTATAPLAAATPETGWFGCQIGERTSAAPPLALALLLAALAGVRRRRSPHR